jgi:hypothetical protein
MAGKQEAARSELQIPERRDSFGSRRGRIVIQISLRTLRHTASRQDCHEALRSSCVGRLWSKGDEVKMKDAMQCACEGSVRIYCQTAHVPHHAAVRSKKNPALVASNGARLMSLLPSRMALPPAVSSWNQHVATS